MPELPDLEIFSRNLNKEFKGKTLKKLSVKHKKKLKMPESQLKQKLEGKKLKEVFREGKELRFRFANHEILGMHLMLHGELHLFNKANEEKNTIAEMLFSNGKGMAVTDWQRMATITLNPEEKIAPDALSNEMDAAYLQQKLSKTRTAIKSFLMDQNKIRGIGNAFADEILYDARIHPLSVCNKIPPQEIKKLARSIRKVLLSAIKKIEKKAPGLISGEIRNFLLIHNHEKQLSPKGRPIQKTELKKRVTYFTDEQELYV